MAMLQDLVLPKSALPENPEIEISMQLPVEHSAPQSCSRYRLAGESNVGLGHGMPHTALPLAPFGGSQLRPPLARFA